MSNRLTILALSLAGCSVPATGRLGPAGDPLPVSAASKPLAKKRAAAPGVEPVVVGNVRYEPLLDGKARGLGQNGGDLVARDATSGARLWVLRVYSIQYGTNMEGDKQDIFISKLSVAPDGRTLNITDERGRQFRVDTVTRAVSPSPPP